MIFRIEIDIGYGQGFASRSPLAVQYAKEAINRGIETDIDTGIAIENGLFGLCFATEEQKQKMRAFLNK